MNYRDANGLWQPIDNAFEPTTGGWENRANELKFRLPFNLSSAVEVSRGTTWLSFALQGANAFGTTSGSTAQYPDALPGVDVVYKADGARLEEMLSLESAAAPHAFTFAVAASSGLSATANRAGGIDFRDAAGGVAFSFDAPYMRDSSGRASGFSRKVSLAVAPSVGGYTITLTANAAWLTDPARVWPVVIDPTVNGVPECTIASGGSADTSFCSAPTVDVGYDGSKISRSLLRFDTSAIPATDLVTDAWLSLSHHSQTTTTALAVNAYELLRTHTSAATWNRYDGSNLWTTPGGDFGPLAASNPSVGGPNPPPSYNWDLTSLAQGWVDGSIPNRGVLLKAVDESQLNLVRFINPVLTVNYTPRLGEAKHYTFETQTLNDRMRVKVNVANGNLILHADDLQIKGTGLDLGIDRYYNSLAFDLGTQWRFNLSREVRLDEYPAEPPYNGKVEITMPGGYVAQFLPNGDGTYSVPIGVNADLVKHAEFGIHELTFRDDGTMWSFRGGQLETIFSRHSTSINFEQSPFGGGETITDTQGRETQVTRTTSYPQNRVTRVTDPSGRVFSYTYASGQDFGRMTSYTDPAGKVTSYEYNQQTGDLTKITTPGGRVTKIAYDGSHRVTSITRVTDPAAETGPTTRYTYNAGNTVSTDPNGHPTTYYYGTQLQVTRVVDALGNERRSTYNAQGDPTSETNAKGDQFTSSYDGKNNPTGETSPTGASTSTAYTHSGYPFDPSSSTDEQGNSCSYHYQWPVNKSRNLMSFSCGTEGSGTTGASFTYNWNGTVATETSRGATTRYTYDSGGNLIRIDHPAPLGPETFTYDGLSRVRTATDGKGQTTTFTYDTLDRVTQVSYSDNSSVSYAYDEDGNQTGRTDGAGASSYTYDKLNRVTNEVLAGQGTNTYGYDPASNMTVFSDGGGTVLYGYDEVDRLIRLTEPNQQQTTFTYDKNYNRTSTTYPNGISQHMTYDASERLIEITGKRDATGAILTKFTYSYAQQVGFVTRDRSLIQSVTDVAGVKTSYTYDALNRLVVAQSPTDSYRYSYDTSSNRTSQTVNGITTNYTYNLADQMTSAGSTAFTYDANGNQTGSSAGLAIAYNAQDQTTSISPPGGIAQPMSYAGRGQVERIRSGTTSFLNNRFGIGREGTASPTISYTRDSDGALLGQRLISGNYYYLFDGLGSVAALTDTGGALAATYKYEPFGRSICVSGCAIANPWRFLGQLGAYADQQTGLLKMGERYYDPAVGRFTQTDPVAGGSLNAYDYAGQDPINDEDVDGLFCKRCKRFAKRHWRGAVVKGATAAGGLAGGAAGMAACGPGCAVLGASMGSGAASFAANRTVGRKSSKASARAALGSMAGGAGRQGVANRFPRTSTAYWLKRGRKWVRGRID